MDCFALAQLRKRETIHRWEHVRRFKNRLTAALLLKKMLKSERRGPGAGPLGARALEGGGNVTREKNSR
jgi:hypothetical protein